MARREGFDPPTARSVAWCSASIWSAPDGSSLLTLDRSSIWLDPDRSLSDRLDDQTEDQAGQPVRTSITHDSFRGVVSSLRLQLALAGRPLRAGIGCGACPTCSSTDSPPSQTSAS